MVYKWNVTLPKLTGQEPRRAYVYLPESYEYEPERRYPVLYMFDGHNVFFDEDATYGKSWGMMEYMDFTETQMIIAAVECNHSPDFGRLKEYSPFTFRDPELGLITGKGQLTMDWMVKVFKPMIDRRYRTLPGREFTYIAGSSMGGLMSLYAVLEYNQYFSKAAALSPSIWTSRNRIEAMVRQAKVSEDTFIYLDYGELELSNHDGMRRQFAKITSMLMERRICVESRIIPGGTHTEASWECQLPFFMNALQYEPYTEPESGDS